MAVAYGIAFPASRGVLGRPAEYLPETLTIGVASPGAGSNSAGAGTYILGGRPVWRDGSLETFSIRSAASATVKVKQFRRAGRTFTLIDEQSVSVVSGLNDFSVAGSTLTAMTLLAGDYLGIYSSTANFVRYDSVTAPSGTEYYFSGSEVTTTLDVTATQLPTSATQLQVGFTVSVARSTALKKGGPLYYLGDNSISVGTTTMPTSSSYFEDHLFPADARLETLQIYGGTAGLLMVVVLEMTATGFAVARHFTIAFSSGDATYNAGTHFPIDVELPKDGMIGYWVIAGTIRSDAFNTHALRYLDATTATGCFPASALTAFSGNTNLNPQIKAGFRLTAAKNLSATRLDYTFDTAIHPEFESTGWSIVGGKAQNSATGLANSLVYRRGGPYAGTITSKFTFAGATDKIAYFRKPMAGWGTVVTVDMSNGSINLHNSWDGSNTLPGIFQTTIASNITFQTGREYEIEFEASYNGVLTATVTDTVTSDQDSVSYACFLGTGALSYSAGRGFGDPGFAVITGTVDVTDIQFSVPEANPAIILFGDSQTDGQGATSRANTFAGRVISAVGSGLIAGVGGAAAVSWFEKVARQFYPERIITFIGTNATNMTTHQTNLQHYNNVALAVVGEENHGICAIPPEAADTNPELVINPYVRTNFSTQVISLDNAMTIGGTGLGADLNPDLYYETLHANDAGQLAQYNQAVADQPALVAAA